MAAQTFVRIQVGNGVQLIFLLLLRRRLLKVFNGLKAGTVVLAYGLRETTQAFLTLKINILVSHSNQNIKTFHQKITKYQKNNKRKKVDYTFLSRSSSASLVPLYILQRNLHVHGVRALLWASQVIILRKKNKTLNNIKKKNKL